MILQNSFCRQCFPSCSVLAIPCTKQGAVWHSALKRREICPSERENDLIAKRETHAGGVRLGRSVTVTRTLGV